MSLACSVATKQLTEILSRCHRVATCVSIQRRSFHVTSANHDKLYNPEDEFRTKFTAPKGWLDYNDVKYPPTEEGELPRPAEVCHQRDNIMMSPKRFWYAAVLVRGLSIDEAIKQCTFNKRLGPKIVHEVLLEAQEMAVHDFNVEFRSNLWIADSFVKDHFRHYTMKRTRMGKQVLKHKYCSYFVRLREGQPPKHYYPAEPSGNEQIEDYICNQRRRRIVHSL